MDSPTETKYIHFIGTLLWNPCFWYVVFLGDLLDSRDTQRLGADRDRNWFRVSGVVFLTTRQTEIHLIQAVVVGLARRMVDFSGDPALVELHVPNVDGEDRLGNMLEHHSKGISEAVITSTAIIGDKSRKGPMLNMYVVGRVGRLVCRTNRNMDGLPNVVTVLGFLSHHHEDMLAH